MMESQIIAEVLQLFREIDIPVCLVGEIALNYYNVPRVVNVSNSY